jgi:hypothetical protein
MVLIFRADRQLHVAAGSERSRRGPRDGATGRCRLLDSAARDPYHHPLHHRLLHPSRGDDQDCEERRIRFRAALFRRGEDGCATGRGACPRADEMRSIQP